MKLLYIIATPIGNLKDITLRALEVLKEVDVLLCEDTRVTQKLLNHYQLKIPLLSYHQHSKFKKIKKIIELLKEGKKLGLVCDSGTPGISDPGNELIAILLKEIPDLKIVPIPGPSALTTAISVSGFPMQKFLFLGFPPPKKKRKKFFEEIVNSEYPVVVFESPYRVLKTLKEVRDEAKASKKNLEVVVCKELTKKFEEIFRGGIDEILEMLKIKKIKGEFVLIFKKI